MSFTCVKLGVTYDLPVLESDPSMGCSGWRAAGGVGRRKVDTLISRATSSRHQWRTHTLSIARTEHTHSEDS